MKTYLNDVLEVFMKTQRGHQYKLRFLDDAYLEALKTKGKEEDRSLNYLINQAIKEFLAKPGAKA
ncbi:hypothetical protein DKE47_006395 [Acinetobacter nosocomialis]|nr:hypothetical protein DKE47_006395 [Acinetobacter nosocomialis]